MTDDTNADELRAALEQIADDHGEIYDDRPTLTVTYETRQGTERTRTGDVWRVSDGGTFDDAVIRFSANIGGDEDAYYLRVRGEDMTLVSISEQGRETDLGDVVSVDADGIDTGRELIADGGTDAYDPTTETTPRTVIHDATLSVYDPETLPDFDVFSAVVDVSADSIEAASGVDA